MLGDNKTTVAIEAALETVCNAMPHVLKVTGIILYFIMSLLIRTNATNWLSSMVQPSWSCWSKKWNLPESAKT